MGSKGIQLSSGDCKGRASLARLASCSGCVIVIAREMNIKNKS